MIDLFKQFFSFKKFMKDRLVTSFFYLGLVVILAKFIGKIVFSLSLITHGNFFGGLLLFLTAFFTILFLFVGWRLVCELMVTVFHINDNLSPDGGKSDLAEIDPFETAREAAANATKKASDSTKSALDKTKTKLAERKDGKVEEVAPDYDDPTPPKKAPAKKKPVAKKTPVKKTVVKKATAKKPAAKKTTAKKPAAKKTTTRKPAAKPKK